MGDLSQKNNAIATKLVGRDELLSADIISEDGLNKIGVTKRTELTNPDDQPIGIPDYPIVTSFDDSLQLDAAKRLKVSNAHEIYTLTGADYFDPVRYMAIETTGGGTITGDANSKSVKLSVGTASGDKAIAQTRRRIEYNKGNSQEVVFTGRFETGKTNLTQRYGYFCGTHGLFFEVTDSTAYVVKRSSTTGSTTEVRVPQSQWNRDKLDGTGPSGITYDVASNKQIVLGIDFLWLGSFHVRYFIAHGSSLILVHNEEYSALLTVPYMDSGMCPLRVEIENTGATASASSMYATCASVKTYGSESHEGRIRGIDTGLNSISVGSTKTIVAGLSIHPDYVKGSIRPLDFGIFPATGNSYAMYEVVYNPTFTETPTWVQLEGIGRGLTNSPAYTGGSVIASGFFPTSNKNQQQIEFGDTLISDVLLGSDINENPDALVLVLQGAGNFTTLFVGSYAEYI